MSNVTNLSTSRQLPASWINALFEKMSMSYGKKFSDQWGAVDPAKMADFWAIELAGYTGPELSRGVVEMGSKDWPPSLPEFKRMCRPPIDPIAAYYEAVAGLEARAKGVVGTWSHPAVYWASSLLSRELQVQAYAQIKDRWAAALKGQLERTEWAEIPPPRVQLAAPGDGLLSRERAAQMMLELGATGITKRPGDAVDHREWARKILDREQQGGSVTLLQANFAREALGAEA